MSRALLAHWFPNPFPQHSVPVCLELSQLKVPHLPFDPAQTGGVGLPAVAPVVCTHSPASKPLSCLCVGLIFAKSVLHHSRLLNRDSELGAEGDGLSGSGTVVLKESPLPVSLGG